MCERFLDECGWCLQMIQILERSKHVERFARLRRPGACRHATSGKPRAAMLPFSLAAATPVVGFGAFEIVALHITIRRTHQLPPQRTADLAIASHRPHVRDHPVPQQLRRKSAETLERRWVCEEWRNRGHKRIQKGRVAVRYGLFKLRTQVGNVVEHKRVDD